MKEQIKLKGGTTKMKNLTQKVIGYALLGTLLAGPFLGAYFGERANRRSESQSRVQDSRIPIVEKNQQLILHASYLKGYDSLGYTILTDMDHNGSWDVAERVHVGYTTGDASKDIYFKEGHGLAQSLNDPSVRVHYKADNLFSLLE